MGAKSNSPHHLINPPLPLDPAAITGLQEIIGVFLYYGRTIDNTMLAARLAVY